MSLPPAISFCGTDTGVGKTFVASALLRRLRERGVDVAPFKPLESGTEPDGVPADATALRDAAGARHTLAAICPWPLPRPVAPSDELERLGIEVTEDDIIAAARHVGADAELLVLETAGGVKSPVTPTMTSLDVSGLLPGSLVLVARDGLGAITRTSAAVDAYTLAGRRVDLVILNDHGDEGPGAAANIRALHRLHPQLPVVTADVHAPCPDRLVELALQLARR